MPVKFQTTRFGELELPSEKILTFPQGLIGFPEVRHYALLDHPGGGPFRWLQSVDRKELAFVVADPNLFFEGYQVRVRPEDLGVIGIETVEEGVMVVILVVPHDPEGITANLLGPIVINPQKRLGCQLVLDGNEYSTRHPIFPAGDGRAGAGTGSVAARGAEPALRKEAAC